MNEDTEFGYKTRQVLNHGIETLDEKVAVRLHKARQTALMHRREHVLQLGLAGFGHMVEFAFLAHARSLLAILALSAGAVGTYYWNGYEQAQEYEEIDSALLADELPPSAYLDRGFQAWLERSSHSPSQ